MNEIIIIQKMLYNLDYYWRVWVDGVDILVGVGR